MEPVKVLHNYSYPRHEASSPATVSDRSSLGSAPGLIDDRTDSEASVDDDDYRYHAHAAELWDSFWQPAAHLGGEEEEEVKDEMQQQRHRLVARPLRKQYPALIPSPARAQQTQQTQTQTQQQQQQTVSSSQAWPLADASRARKPAATYVQQALSSSSPRSPAYSVFPRPSAPSSASMSITTDFSPTSHYAPSTSVSAPAKAPRSQRPWEEVVTPCIRLVQSSTSSPSPPDENRRPPLSPVMNWHPFPPRSSSALDANGRPRTATSSRQGHYQQSSSSHPRAPRHHKSMAHFPPPPPPPPPPEPQSVFESDSDDSDSDHPRSFFRFHRRNDSDSRRSAKPPPTPDGGPPVRSSRPQTAPSLADLTSNSRLVKQEPQRRKRQGHDVFGRMLGRRSR